MNEVSITVVCNVRRIILLGLVNISEVVFLFNEYVNFWWLLILFEIGGWFCSLLTEIICSIYLEITILDLQLWSVGTSKINVFVFYFPTFAKFIAVNYNL